MAKLLHKKIAYALNLSDYEAKVYLAGLQTKATVTELASKASIARTAVYPPLSSLIDKGLMFVTQYKKRKYYTSLELQQLKCHLEYKMNLLEEVANVTHSNEVVIGQQNITSNDDHLSVRYFPGDEGMIMAARIFLEKSKEKLWKTFEQPEFMLDKFGEHSFDTYIQLRVEKGIHARVIIPEFGNSKWSQERIQCDNNELRKTIVVSKKLYPIDASIAIAGDMILMTTVKNSSFTILLNNPELAHTLESIHDMVWDRYKR